MTEQKKAGIILDFRVFSAQPRHPNEPDIILTVTYPNMAALDRSTVLGGELIREMVLK